jgi:putative transposase
MKIVKTYKYKLKPTKKQEQIFTSWLGTCRFVYNCSLEYKILMYKQYNKNLCKFDIINELPQSKKELKLTWLNEVHSQTLQDVIERLDKTYQSFFRGGGFPKFAKKDKFKSFSFPQFVKLLPSTSNRIGKVQLPKIGDVNYINSRNFDGKIKRTNITKEYNGWFITFMVEEDNKPLPPSTNEIGIDLGITNFATTSNGDKYYNPKPLRKYTRKLRRIQRSVSRKKKGSNNRKKEVKKLQKIYAKIKNIGRDFQQKLSTQLIRENQTIVVENLKVKNMLKNHKLAKSISDVGWYGFTEQLKYKAKWYERNFEKVNPHNTSKTCSDCGTLNTTLTLDVREWVCTNCGSLHDRDINAAKNILNLRWSGRPSVKTP